MKRLKRVRIGRISITGLGPGQFRVLGKKDVDALHSTIESAERRGQKKAKMRSERGAKGPANSPSRSEPGRPRAR